jgi:5-methylcytosine-specific restriction endonuclease McrA
LKKLNKPVAAKRVPIPAKLRLEVVERDGICCHYCGAKTLKSNRQCDHIIPVTKNGLNEAKNLVISCKSCNRRKSARDYNKFIEDEIIRVQRNLDTLLGRKNK